MGTYCSSYLHPCKRILTREADWETNTLSNFRRKMWWQPTCCYYFDLCLILDNSDSGHQGMHIIRYLFLSLMFPICPITVSNIMFIECTRAPLFTPAGHTSWRACPSSAAAVVRHVALSSYWICPRRCQFPNGINRCKVSCSFACCQFLSRKHVTRHSARQARTAHLLSSFYHLLTF